MLHRLVISVGFSIFAFAAAAQHQGHQQSGRNSPYTGQEQREIKSLSADDIAELERGGGWGLAKAAELNGVPGPAHLLEMRKDIGLTADRVAKLEVIFKDMQQKAIVEGKRLIEREKALEDAFRGGPVSDETLRKLLAEIEASRSALRYIHLAAHLTSPPLLTPEQIKLSMAATNCARWRIKSVPVWLREKGCMSPGELWRRAH
jgi:Spy/CpxP family protein refolding chaperone